MIDRPWGGSAKIGKVYRVQAQDLGRVGKCWMRGRLLVGDLVTPIAHSGDCFYTYLLLEGGEWMTLGRNRGVPAYRAHIGITFGAYQLGELLPNQPTEREYHLLRAGEMVNFSEVSK